MDSHVESGTLVPPNYDSLLGKLIVFGNDRAEALVRLQQALHRCRLEGIATNLSLLQRLAAEPAFVEGGITTAFLPALLAQGAVKP